MARSIHLAPNYSDWTKSQLIERLGKLQHQNDELRATNTVRRTGQNLMAEVEAEHDAIQLNELFLNALENVPVSLALFDADDRFVICNSEFHVFSGIPAERLLPGTKFEELLRLRVASGVLSEEIGGDEEEWIAQRMDRHRSPGSAFQVRVAGGWRQLLEARLSDGGTLLTTMDITELKQAEQNAADAKARLNDAIESISDGLILYDADERLVLCNRIYREFNPSFQDILVPGVRLEDVIRASAVSEGAPLEIDDIDSWTRTRLEDYRAGTGSREILHVDGRWILARISQSKKCIGAENLG